MRDHSEPASPISRVTFLRTRALAAYACDELHGLMLAEKMRMLALAATVGCVTVLEELVDMRGCIGPDLLQQVCGAAASHGQMEALVWLRERGFSCGTAVCSRAASAGRLEALQYLREHGCPWDGFSCSAAALGGHLEVLRYAHEHGCPWDEETCSAAAQQGHLEVLRYAREHGCPWDEYSCSYAAQKVQCLASRAATTTSRCVGVSVGSVMLATMTRSPCVAPSSARFAAESGMPRPASRNASRPSASGCRQSRRAETRGAAASR
jgi:hypothetical protein